MDLLYFWANGMAVLRARWYLRRASLLGSNVRIWGKPLVKNRGTLVVGERVRVVSTVATVELAVESGARLEIGSRVFINYGCSIGADRKSVV